MEWGEGMVKVVEGEAVEVVDGLVLEVGRWWRRQCSVWWGTLAGSPSASLTVRVKTSADFLY